MYIEKAPTRAVFWDIDGTLLLTARAGMIAWEDAYGASGEGRVFPPVRPDGMTDHQIAAWLLLGHPGPFDTVSDEVQREADRLVAAYAARLPQVLPQRQGRVLSNVPGALETVDRHPAITSWVVTGNVEAGAVAKLQHYGLARFFAPAQGLRLRGAFSERVEPRREIVARAAAEVRRLETTEVALEVVRDARGGWLWRLCGAGPDLEVRTPPQVVRRPERSLALAEMLVIGDTPHDIEGARAVGIPTLALASNTHTVDELEAHRPWLTLPALPEAEAFGALLAQRFQPTTA